MGSGLSLDINPSRTTRSSESWCTRGCLGTGETIVVGTAGGRRISSGSMGKPIVSRVCCGSSAGNVDPVGCGVNMCGISDTAVNGRMATEAPVVCGDIV